MKRTNPPTVIEVGKKKTAVVQRRGGHTNVMIRPTRRTLRQAARLAAHEYGAGSQSVQSILARL